MFQRLAALVVRFWPVFLAGWLALLVVSSWAAPDLNDVADSGEFAFLPIDAPSRVSERLFQESWNDSLASRVVIVASCRDPEDQLTEEDKRFIDEILKPQLEQIAADMGGLAQTSEDEEEEEEEDREGRGEQDEPEETTKKRSLIVRVRTFQDPSIGRLLESRNGRASLVIVELTTEFLDRANFETIERIERLISTDTDPKTALGLIWDKDAPWWQETELSPGEILQRLKLSTSGEATVGRDMLKASDESASATEFWTVILVIALLVALYRAPIVALIPLVTVVVAVKISMSLLTLGAEAGWLNLFRGIEVYVTVLSYGAGVDYCFFLIARYREELEKGKSSPVAIEHSLGRVGAALTASAGTVMCGIGMMVFAEFGKFQQAGIGITFGLVIVLAAALTFTPTLLRIAGAWAFWPRVPGATPADAGWVDVASPLVRPFGSNPVQAAWDRLAALLLKRPATIWLISVLLLAPFAAWGAWHYTTLSYGLLSELPRDNPSVHGATEVQAHFPAGNAGPVTLILRNGQVDFGSDDGREILGALTGHLEESSDQLQIADVRSLVQPYGQAFPETQEKGGSFAQRARRRVRRKRIQQHYVSSKPDRDGQVTRLDIVFREDPFSRDSINQLDRLQQSVRTFLTSNEDVTWPSPGANEALFAIGPTASIRDLKQVTDDDQIRIDVLVLSGVYAILLLLLRRPAISLYLLVGVFFSYLASLGVTFVVFEFLWPGEEEFAGLDWKVPMFLFTILIAVGEDYNIFLMTRIEEEQREHGLVDGVIEALKKTGSIIAGCGLIMAGTFASLLAGSLVGMHQLGFALAFGVLLDTLVVMPILVPAWLILLYRGRFGVLGRWLGTPREVWSAGDDVPSAPATGNQADGNSSSGSEDERLPGNGGLSADR